MRSNFLRLLFCLCTLGALLTPSSPRAEVFNPQSFTLKNGLQFIVVENHRAPVVHHMVVYKVGARDEPMGKSGMAHFMEHLMFKGTDKVASGDFSKIIRSVGGRDNAFTTQDYTAYYQSVAREYLPMVMEMEADRMINLTLTDKIVAVERDVILKERGQRTDNDPIGAFWEEVNTLIFTNHPYSVPVIGWRHEIAELSKSDIENFYKKWYAPNNAIVIISGDINKREVENLAREYYADLDAKVLPPRGDTTIPVLKADRRILKESDQIQQPLWSRHYLAPQAKITTIKQSDALQFFTDIFGGGSTGLLYQDLVVNKKLATNAFASYADQSIGPARFSIIVTPADGVSLTQINTAVDDLIAKTLRDGFDKEKIKDTAQNLKIQAIYARDSLGAPARIIGGALATGLDVKTIEKWPSRVDDVAYDDVLLIAKQVFDNPNNAPVTGIMIPKGGAYNE